MLDRVVQCCSGDKSYFGINWKWLTIFFRNSTYHVSFFDLFIDLLIFGCVGSSLLRVGFL